MNLKDKKQIGLAGYTLTKRNLLKLQVKKDGELKFYVKMNLINI